MVKFDTWVKIEGDESAILEVLLRGGCGCSGCSVVMVKFGRDDGGAKWW